MDERMVCGTCKYHETDGCDFICNNPESDYYSDWTEYDDTCDEWEEAE